MNPLRIKLAILLVRAIGALPLPINRWLGGSMGTYAYYLNTRMAQVTRKNTTICLPHIQGEALDHFVKTSLKETGRTAAEVCYVLQQPFSRITKHIEAVEGEKHILEALQRGKGLLVLAPHLGNWEVLGLHLTRYAEVTNLYQPPKHPGFEEMVRKSRCRSGSKLVPTNTKGVAALLKQLKANGICGILPDQNPNDLSGGDFSPFFGEHALTMTLIFKLVQRTGCQAIFAFAKRTPKGFKLIYRPAPESLYSEQQSESLRGLNTGIENLVREAPEQYQWEYKRFKVQNPQRPVRHYS